MDTALITTMNDLYVSPWPVGLKVGLSVGLLVGIAGHAKSIEGAMHINL